MTEIKCAIKGFEDLRITLPDRFLVRHHEFWAAGVRDAREAFGESVSLAVMRLFGSIALCEKIDNAPTESVEEWPLELFNWFVDEIYTNRFELALYPKKESLEPAPTSPKD